MSKQYFAKAIIHLEPFHILSNQNYKLKCVLFIFFVIDQHKVTYIYCFIHCFCNIIQKKNLKGPVCTVIVCYFPLFR